MIAIFSADSFDTLMQVELGWGDVFNVDIYPACSAEEGLRIGPDVFGRLARMRQG